MKHLFITISLYVLFAVPNALSAPQTTIRGRVIDKETGEGLPAANVIVPGTYKGAASDMNGNFTISGLDPGDYDIKVSMIGYTEQLQTGVQVNLNKVVEVNFKMSPTVLALGQTLEVIGEKPLFESQVTSSQQRLSSEEIDKKVVETVDDLVGDQLGVVVQDNKIHIRGGRADESLYMIDGQSIKDPLSGYTNTLYINASAIQELKVITGGFDAEYGQAMSGVVDIETKEGDQNYVGAVNWKSDNWLQGLIKSYNTDIIEFNVGGPEPISTYLLKGVIPGKMTAFVSGYGHFTDTYLPTASKLYPQHSSFAAFSPREENDWHILGKIAWTPTPGQKLTFSYDRSLNINQGYFLPRIDGGRGYPYEYEKMLDNYNTITKQGVLWSAQWTHTLTPRTFYKVSFSKFDTGLHSAVQNKDYSLYDQRFDLAPINYIPDTRGNILTRAGDGFWDTGDAENWYHYFSKNWTLRTDLTTQPSSKHSIKTGFEARYTDMQVIDINAPWFGETGLGRNHDYYRVFPNDGSFYIQDRITYDGMIVNIGFRYDYWFPGKYVDDAVKNPETVTITSEGRKKYFDETFELFGMRGKGHLSPRLGISHPITDNDMLYLHYGHFSQKPKGHYVYAKLASTSEATYQLFGNPNLNPTTTVAYEMGLKHRFNANQTIEIKAYYKDMFDYPTSTQVRKFSPRYGNISYLMYVNMDYARSRGVEVRFRRRYSRFLSGNIDFTYAKATGKSSTPNTNLLVSAGKVTEKPLGESSLSWDRPFRLSADVFFDMPKGADARVFGLKIPEQWSFSLRWDIESGKRYRQLVDVDNNIYAKDEYSGISDPWTRLDIRFRKDFWWNKIGFSFYVEIENALDTKVPRILNPVTGRPYEPGDVIPITWYDDPRDLPPDNPARYDWPRRVLTGVQFQF